MTNDIRNFILTMNSGYNLKSRIFLLIPQRQRMQPKFMTDSIRNFIHNKQNRDNLKL